MKLLSALAFAFSRGAPAVDGFLQVSGDRGTYVDRFVGVEGRFVRAGSAGRSTINSCSTTMFASSG
jgi:hypothetical protein